MNTSWNLENIYSSVSSEEFKRDVNDYRKSIEDLNAWCDNNLNDTENAVEKLEDYINYKNKLQTLSKTSLYVNLALSVDTGNETLVKANSILKEIESNISYHQSKLVEFLKNIDNLNSVISKSQLLREHSYFLKEQYSLGSFLLSPKEESIIAKMKSNGSQLLEKQWEQLTSGLTIEFKGKKEPLAAIRNYAYSADREIRRAAYEAEIAGYKAIEIPVAFCLNGIKGEVITTSKLRGYSSPLEMTLLESRINRNILDAMFSALRDSLPQIRKYFYKKAEILGYKKSLPFYELFAPVSQEDLSYSVEEAADFVIKVFYGYSKDLGDFAKYAIDNRWIDIMPKEGKVGGAFCETIHSIKESRILTNFGGTFNDVLTIAHELGHAFHNTRLFNNTELNSFYPMPIAETASTFCETLVINKALEGASKNEKLIILENDLQGLTQCIVDIYSRFLFEDSVFKEREKGFLSVKELQRLMEKAQIEAYGDGLDKNYLNRDMWVCKPHYYDSEFNYYNFPYAFGALLSKALYSIYQQKGSEFIALYDKILASSATDSLYNVLKIADIDLEDKSFWQKGLNIIIAEIDEFSKL